MLLRAIVWLADVDAPDVLARHEQQLDANPVPVGADHFFAAVARPRVVYA